jgi:uncharacterized membrane protein SirB2
VSYALLKAIHGTAVAVSFAGFVARGAGALAGAAWLRRAWVRRLPHGVDTVLLASAIGLAAELGITPERAPWLAAKIGGLLAYIALGMLALRPGVAAARRAGAFAAAIACFLWIVSVAIGKSPLGAFAAI